jgi:hypothetical protein
VLHLLHLLQARSEDVVFDETFTFEKKRLGESTLKVCCASICTFALNLRALLVQKYFCTQFTCFTGTKVQTLTESTLKVRVYDKNNRKYMDNKCLLGTLRDDSLGKCDVNLHMHNMLQVLTLLALLVQKVLHLRAVLVAQVLTLLALLVQKVLHLRAVLVARQTRGESAHAEQAAGAHFTCFAGTIVCSVTCSTKVSVIKMRREALYTQKHAAGAQFTCFTGIKKRRNTDATGAAGRWEQH